MPAKRVNATAGSRKLFRAAFGLALYAGNLHGMTAFFPWFTPLRTLDTIAAHMLFGILAATAYRHLARRR